ncbi:MAG: Holliday junction resolvase RuvX [bacterium]|nr:Holliday junction resolvase RuvX [bacterium]
MKYMGIDYGTKRVGIALSDETNGFALPLKVIENTRKLFDEINTIVCDKEVTHIIVGESKDFKGEDNKVMDKIRSFKEDLENKFTLPVIFEPEFLTSHAAERFQGKNDMHDASAAALILQSYLDRIKNT